MLPFLKKFERGVIGALSVMMVAVVFLATMELGWIIIKDVLTPPVGLLEIEELLDIFGFFLLVLIGLELIETIRSYLADHVVHVEVVVEVAMIAIARKVIILDIKKLESHALLGIAAIILALTAAFFCLKHWRRRPHEGGAAPEPLDAP